MPRTPYAELPPDEKERQRAFKRTSAKKARKRALAVYASSEETLARARARMPPGLSLTEFLSQLIDRIAAGSLVPRPPDTQ